MPVLNLSELIIQHPEVTSFRDLLTVVERRGKSGQVLLHFDIKPDFPDTPRNWETEIENAFMWGPR